MSDEDAVLWKLAFGVLLLALCGLAVGLRKPHAPPLTAPAAVARPAPSAVHAPPVPADVHDEAPPRIEVVIEEARGPARTLRSRPHASSQRRVVALRTRAPAHARRVPPPRIHVVVATRPQYPFDPRERWNPRF